MFRYLLYLNSLIFGLIIIFGPVGCRIDDEKSVKSKVEKEDGGESGSAGKSKPDGAGKDAGGGAGKSGSDDGGAIKPEVDTVGAAGSESVGAGPYTLTGRVSDNVTILPVANIRVIALNNDDLSELGIETVTGPDGTFTLEGITEERICIQVAGTEGDDERIDTYSCNVPSGEKDRELISCGYDVADMIISNTNPSFSIEGKSELAKEYGIVAISGRVYYRDTAGEEIPVDCATVVVDEAIDDTYICYFEDTLPDPNRIQTDSGGRFLVTMLAPGEVHLSAFANGEKIGSVSTPIRPPIDPASDKDLYSLYIVRIYADTPIDPTPDCDQ